MENTEDFSYTGRDWRKEYEMEHAGGKGWRKEYEWTANRKVYNRHRKRALENDAKIHCGYCAYHKAENSTTKWYGHYELDRHYTIDIRVNRVPNWKLATKNRKQWMEKKNIRYKKIDSAWGGTYTKIVWKDCSNA